MLFRSTLDRKAQRTSREKTRSHIAHLEKMVKLLSEKNGSTVTVELVEEIDRLHAEVKTLRKIIEGVNSILETDLFQSTAVR